MSEKPILTLEDIRAIWSRLELGDWFDGAEDFAAALQSALMEKLRGEPRAWITTQTKDGKQKLEEGCAATNPAYCAQHKEWLWEPLFTLLTEQD